MIINNRLSIEASQKLIDGTFQGFVNSVIDVISEAYGCTYSRVNQICANWEETKFTANLTLDIETISRRREYFWYVNSNEESLTEEMLLDPEISPKKAKKIDIVIKAFSDPELYFGMECKLVGITNSTGRIDYCREYVIEGMNRFIIDESYSGSLSEGGMIGYVISGSTEQIINKINMAITKKLSVNDCICSNGNSSAYFLNNFQSNHIRKKTKNILTLHHIFLDFKQMVNN